MSALLIRDPRLLPYYLTPAEAAALLRRSLRTLQEYCTAGVLRRGKHWVSPKRRRLFLRDALLDFMREAETVGPMASTLPRCNVNLGQSPALAAAYQREHGR